MFRNIISNYNKSPRIDKLPLTITLVLHIDAAIAARNATQVETLASCTLT